MNPTRLLAEDGTALLLESGDYLLLERRTERLPTRRLVWLYTLSGHRLLPLHDLGELVVEDRLGDLESLAFTIRADDNKAFAVVADARAEYDGRFYRMAELHQYRSGSGAYVDVYAEAEWLDLGKHGPGGTVAILGKTALDGLARILEGSGWTAAVDPVDVDVYSMEDIDATALALVRRWAGIVGREVAWDTAARTVTLVPTLGANRGIGFRWGHNLRSVDRRYRPPIATRLYAFGANNLEISAVNPTTEQFIEDYSWYTAQGLTIEQARAAFRKDQVWNDERFLVALNLFDAAVRRLSILAQPTVSYELSVADFASLTATTADDVGIGDLVRVRDSAFDLDLSTRVVRLIRHPLAPQSNEVELAYLQPGLGETANVDAGSTRTIDYSKLSVFIDSNAAALVVGAAYTPFAAVAISSTGESTVVLGATFKGTATGAGVVRFSAAVDGTDLPPTYDFAFVDGQQVEFSWPTFATGVDASSTALISWRARIVSGSGTIAVEPQAGRGWLLTPGAVGIGVNQSPNQSIEETLVLVYLGATAAAETTIAAGLFVADVDDSVAYTVATATDAELVSFP